MPGKHKVIFLPENKTGYFEDNTSLRSAALSLGIAINSTCGGMGKCGKCRIAELNCNEKEFNTKDFNANELSNIRQACSTQLFLSCQQKISKDMICYIPESSITKNEQIISEGKSGNIKLEPDIKKIFVEVPLPQLGIKSFDIGSVISALNKTGLKVSTYSYKACTNISQLLRENSYKVSCIIDGEELIAVESGNTTDKFYGIAIDIGTTTIAAKLLNLNNGKTEAITSALNNQHIYGADVISRVNFIIENKDGLERLHETITNQINHLVSILCSLAQIKPFDIYKIVIAGNTIMQHITLKLDPRNLAFSPYTPVMQGPLSLEAKSLKIELNPSAILYSVPNLGGFVGSDITSVLTILDLDESNTPKLVIDIGTNGEVVLGSKERILCASAPAGPAWEGACIACGMRASEGAIEAVLLKEGDIEFKTIGDVEPKGICGSGIIDLITKLLHCGIVDNWGRILSSEELPVKISNKLKDRIKKSRCNHYEIDLIEGKIILSQQDIREIQLAKAAISSTIEILMKELSICKNEISEVYIAGAFGNHLNSEDAIGLGLIPRISKEKINFIGNAALSGAEAVLLSSAIRQKAERLSKLIEYVELSGREDFQEIFINSMFFE